MIDRVTVGVVRRRRAAGSMERWDEGVARRRKERADFARSGVVPLWWGTGGLFRPRRDF